MPRRHRKSGGADERAALGRDVAQRTDASDGRRFDLRSRAGGDEPGQAGAEALPRGFDMSEPIRFTLDGAEAEAEPGETIWQVANRRGIEIPHLCWLPKPGYRADGNCRACMVEIEGERVLAASCVRKPAPGMKVQTASERPRFSRKMVFELLIGDQPDRAVAHDPKDRK